jgi:hypothetical protein
MPSQIVSFQYTMCPLDFKLSGAMFWRPMLGLVLSNGSERLACSAMIDSGADSCNFPRRFMELLGLSAADAETVPVMGVGSANETYIHPVKITIANAQGISPFVAKVGFTDNLDAWGIGLLGQFGFFDRFKVCFDLRQKRFDLEQYEENQTQA